MSVSTIEATETTGPPLAVDDPATNRRVYLHPLTGELFTSATTALSIIDKQALPYWYGKQSAICALESLQAMMDAVRVPPCNGQHCGICLTCLALRIRHAGDRERDAAADRGSRFHNVAEQRALTGRWISFDPDLEPYVEQFERFIDLHKVEFHAAEVTVINRAHRWGGTLDTVLTCGWMPPKHRNLIGVPLLGDYKTGNKIYESAGLQLAGYRHGEAVLLPDGTEHHLPLADTETALSIQIRADDFWVRPCPVGDAAYAKFLRTLALWRDINEPDLKLVGRAMYKPRPKKES